MQQKTSEQILNKIGRKPSRRIGIVEDNPVLLNLYREILISNGHEIVFEAESGEELVRAVHERNLPNLQVLITDDRMGSISGFEAARILSKYNSDIQIIVASAEDGELETKARKSGFLYLRKPFSLLKLVEAVL
jgi:CheY-like chemotaxis protein